MKPSEIKVILDDEKIKKALKTKEVIKAIEEGFRKKISGLIDLPPKIGPKLGIKGAFADAMPVSVFNKKGNLETLGIKWIAGFPDNVTKNLPYLNPVIVLNDPKNGLPKAILKGNWITAIRTAGVSAVTAKYLAPKKKNITIGIFGLGLQAYVHVLVFREIFKNAKFLLYAHDKKFLTDFRRRLPKEKFLTSENPHEVVKNSDIVLSATTFPKKVTPYIFSKDLKNDVLLLPVDYGSRIHPEVYKTLDDIYTDDTEQYKFKSKLKNYFSSNPPSIKKETGALVTKKYKRKIGPQRILAFNLGIALFDVLVAELFLKKAVH